MDDEFLLHERIGYVIKHLHFALTRLIDDALVPTGLTSTQFAALTHLRHRGPMSGAELARTGLVSPQAASTLLDRLTQRGLVERHPRAGSRRDLQARLTEAGRTAQHRAACLVAQAEDQLTAQLGEQRTTQLLTAAGHLTDLAKRRSTSAPGDA